MTSIKLIQKFDFCEILYIRFVVGSCHFYLEKGGQLWILAYPLPNELQMIIRNIEFLFLGFLVHIFDNMYGFWFIMDKTIILCNKLKINLTYIIQFFFDTEKYKIQLLREIY